MSIRPTVVALIALLGVCAHPNIQINYEIGAVDRNSVTLELNQEMLDHSAQAELSATVFDIVSSKLLYGETFTGKRPTYRLNSLKAGTYYGLKLETLGLFEKPRTFHQTMVVRTESENSTGEFQLARIDGLTLTEDQLVFGVKSLFADAPLRVLPQIYCANGSRVIQSMEIRDRGHFTFDVSSLTSNSSTCWQLCIQPWLKVEIKSMSGGKGKQFFENFAAKIHCYSMEELKKQHFDFDQYKVGVVYAPSFLIVAIACALVFK